MHALPRHSADATCIAMLAAMTAASFLVLQCFAGDFGVIALAVVKAAMAVGFLAPWLRDASRRMALARQACRLVGLSLLSCTLPFVLSALAAPRGGSAMLAVAHASLPLAVTLVGAVWLGERVGGVPFAGFIVGLGGATLLSWQWLAMEVQPQATGATAGAASGVLPSPTTFALAAASVAALCSVLGTRFARQRLTVADSVVLAIAAQGGSAFTLLLPAAWLWSDAGRHAANWSRVVELGVVALALGYFLYQGLDQRGARLDERCARRSPRGRGP